MLGMTYAIDDHYQVDEQAVVLGMTCYRRSLSSGRTSCGARDDML